MKLIVRSLLATILSTALVCPGLSADNRDRGRGGSPAPTHAPASRPSRPTTPSSRPGNNGQRPGNNNRPGNNQRPGNNGHNRPGNNWRPGNDRPGGPGGPGNHRPPQVNHGHHHHHHHHGPVRPHMRPHSPFFRPTPPPSWRPAPGWRPFRSILGISLGTSFSISINALINSGYSINSYGNHQIYLTNVPMLNLYWPDAVMYYNDMGLLYGSQFIYSTPAYNMNQYNMAYTSLTAAYGAPVSLQNLSNGIEATWWGSGNQFIRLSYISDYANNGLIRYYTTLSFGN